MQYKEEVVNHAGEPLHFQPRNSRQFKHCQTSAVQHKVGKDAIMNLHELAYMLVGFVWSITTFTDLMVCFGCSQILDIISKQHQPSLSYDTTFCLGDFYLSVLVSDVSMFTERPIMPIAFILHERKFDIVHEVLFSAVKKRLPRLKNVSIVTDGEAAIVKAIQNVLPDWKLFACWNHVVRDVEFWLKKHSGRNEDIAVYKSQVREILACENEHQMLQKVDSFRDVWSPAFVSYFENSLQKRIDMAYTGHLIRNGMDGSGITTNTAESMNALLKRFQVIYFITILFAYQYCIYFDYSLLNVYGMINRRVDFGYHNNFTIKSYSSSEKLLVQK